MNHRKLGPPFLRRAVFIVVLTSAIAADGEGKLARAAIAQLDEVRGLPLVEVKCAAPSPEAVDNGAKENQQQAGVDDVDGQL